MATTQAEEFRIIQLEGDIKIEKKRLSVFRSQKNMVTALHAEALERVIEEMQDQLDELLAKREITITLNEGTVNLVYPNTSTNVAQIDNKELALKNGFKIPEYLSNKLETEGHALITQGEQKKDNKGTSLEEQEKHTNWEEPLVIHNEIEVKTEQKTETKKKIKKPASLLNHNTEPLTKKGEVTNPEYLVNVTNVSSKSESLNINKPSIEDFSKFYRTIIPTEEMKEIAEMYKHYENLNWKTKGTPIKDWRMAVRMNILSNKGEQVMVDTPTEIPTFEEFKKFYHSINLEANNKEVAELYGKYEKANWISRGKKIRDWRVAARVSISLKKKKEAKQTINNN